LTLARTNDKARKDKRYDAHQKHVWQDAGNRAIHLPHHHVRVGENIDWALRDSVGLTQNAIIGMIEVLLALLKAFLWDECRIGAKA
jgi:hypothetical protein